MGEEINKIVEAWLASKPQERRSFLIWLNQFHRLKNIAEIIEVIEARRDKEKS